MRLPFEDQMRKAEISRSTAETALSVALDLDGDGRGDIETGIGFFDHMLEQIARHAMIDLRVRATGDLHIDDHHTVEDVGIALGRALAEALGDKAAIRRYGSCLLAMDEALVRAALDLSGRPYLVWRIDFPAAKIGSFDTDLVREFFTAVAMNARLTLNLAALDGENSHHIAEAAFKAFARALRAAVEPDPRATGIPSTKGTLSG
jgi:imidazoleglycerol-phosphate dehydratase